MTFEGFERRAIVREARSWVRTPYHPQGDIKGIGVDCGMLWSASLSIPGSAHHSIRGLMPMIGICTSRGALSRVYLRSRQGSSRPAARGCRSSATAAATRTGAS